MSDAVCSYEDLIRKAERIGQTLEGRVPVGLSLPEGVELPDIREVAGTRFGALGEVDALILPDALTHRVAAIRILRCMNAPGLILLERVGSLSERFRPGDYAAVSDHINLTGINPLAGANDTRIGPRYPDMSEPYDLSRIDRHGAIRTGVYAALSAPPTGAEQRFLRAAGADIYGPGVAPDVLVAVHCGLPVMALGGVVSACSPDDPDGFFLTEAETGTLDAGLIEIAKRMVSVHTVH